MRALAKPLLQLSPVDEMGTIRWKPLWLLYTVASFFMIATWNAKFWDAWFMYANVDALESVERACPIDRCKLPFTYIYEQPLLRIGDWTLKLLVVLGFAVAGWLFWKLLKYSTALSEFQCSAATVLFVLLPINGARVGLSTVRASLLLPVFLFGALLFTYRRAISSGIGFLLVLYAGFWPSFQIYALAIPAVLAARDLSQHKAVSRRTFFSALLLATIPFLHIYILQPQIVELGFAGAPGTYNSIRPNFLIRAVLVCGILSAPLLGSLFETLARRKSLKEWSPTLTSVGLGLLALGTFPYMAVGHFANLSDWVVAWLPDNSDWDSRHQLLQGPGFALVIASGLTSVVAPHRRRFSLNILVVISVVVSVATYSNYHVDGLKQRDVMRDLQAAAEDFEGISIVSFTDYSSDLNARGRSIRSYEWKGLAEAALGKSITIWEAVDNPPELGCRTEVIGKSVTVRKSTGRLKATLTRSRVAAIEIRDLVACRSN